MYRGALRMYWRIEGRLNARNYLNTLDVMLPPVREIFPSRNFIFQHDNCSLHTAHRVRDYLVENNIETRPDINIIENVTNKLQKLNVFPQNRENVLNFIKETWESLAENENLSINLINLVFGRLQEIINDNGAMTSY